MSIRYQVSLLTCLSYDYHTIHPNYNEKCNQEAVCSYCILPFLESFCKNSLNGFSVQQQRTTVLVFGSGMGTISNGAGPTIPKQVGLLKIKTGQ